jgi:hypothetical protein
MLSIIVDQIILFILYLGYLGVKYVSLLIFTSVLFCVFISSTIYMNFHSFLRNHNCSFVLFAFSILLALESIFYNWIMLWNPFTMVHWFFVLKETREGELRGKWHSENNWVKTLNYVKRRSENDWVKTLNCVKHESGEDIFFLLLINSYRFNDVWK